MEEEVKITSKNNSFIIEFNSTVKKENIYNKTNGFVPKMVIDSIYDSEVTPSKIICHTLENMEIFEYIAKEPKQKAIFITENGKITSYLKIKKKHVWELFHNGKNINSYNHNIEDSTYLLEYIEYLKSFMSLIKFNINPEYLSFDVGIFDKKRSNIICENTDISLVLRTFYKENPEQMKLEIINNHNLDIIGSVLMNFRVIDNLYPEYTSNIEIEVDKYFQNQGYATKALQLLLEYINQNKEINCLKILLAIEPENTVAQQVALKNGARCYHEGVVPKSSSLYLNKRYTKINLYEINMK